jgi:hypothetical protein
MKKLLVLLIVVLATISLGFLSGNSVSAGKITSFRGGNPNDTFYCREKNFPKQDVSPSEEKELLYMREEEKMAHDIYSLMYDKWGLRPFYNITGAEERHMAAIKSIIDKYTLADPVKNIKVGVFTNAEINKLYSVLIEQGNKSAIDALKAGAEVEEVDIKDLMQAIKDTDNNDIKFVYNNLLNASGNHLRAFMRNIERRGETYTPKHLDKKAFEEILND